MRLHDDFGRSVWCEIIQRWTNATRKSRRCGSLATNASRTSAFPITGTLATKPRSNRRKKTGKKSFRPVAVGRETRDAEVAKSSLPSHNPTIRQCALRWTENWCRIWKRRSRKSGTLCPTLSRHLVRQDRNSASLTVSSTHNRHQNRPIPSEQWSTTTAVPQEQKQW